MRITWLARVVLVVLMGLVAGQAARADMRGEVVYEVPAAEQPAQAQATPPPPAQAPGLPSGISAGETCAGKTERDCVLAGTGQPAGVLPLGFFPGSGRHSRLER